ncbi:MAG: GntR family transcriptional regulator [Victivallales bacterium]|nr:GntR family transcriptional regulator [Victivallales bacterium]
MTEKNESLPLYRQVEQHLKNYIESNKLKRHARLPSENQLAEKYGINVGTVRKALNNLIHENIIYRRHGQGTFVAPRARKGKLLIVPNRKDMGNFYRDDYFDFFLGALQESSLSNIPLEPIIVDTQDFRDNVRDLKLIYPDLAGIIFFRGIDNCRLYGQELRRAKIPFMFYGPNIYGHETDRYPSFFHDECSIATMTVEHLKKKGWTRIAGIESGGITPYRSELMAKVARLHTLKYQAFAIDDDQNFCNNLTALLKNDIIGNFDLLTCFVDNFSITAIQIIERDLGYRVPNDIAVIGVDDMPASRLLRPSLTSISINNYANGRRSMRLFADYVTNHKVFTEYCDLSLIERDSTRKPAL